MAPGETEHRDSSDLRFELEKRQTQPEFGAAGPKIIHLVLFLQHRAKTVREQLHLAFKPFSSTQQTVVLIHCLYFLYC